MNKLNESGYAFIWIGRVRNRWKPIKFALKNLWNAINGYELTLQWDPKKMGDTSTEPFVKIGKG